MTQTVRTWFGKLRPPENAAAKFPGTLQSHSVAIDPAASPRRTPVAQNGLSILLSFSEPVSIAILRFAFNFFRVQVFVIVFHLQLGVSRRRGEVPAAREDCIKHVLDAGAGDAAAADHIRVRVRLRRRILVALPHFLRSDARFQQRSSQRRLFKLAHDGRRVKIHFVSTHRRSAVRAVQLRVERIHATVHRAVVAHLHQTGLGRVVQLQQLVVAHHARPRPLSGHIRRPLLQPGRRQQYPAVFVGVQLCGVRLSHQFHLVHPALFTVDVFHEAL
mmetsp:Transcript_13759/g.51364  ORF Transcript_13759/g.51364 Transcript_13759/m.51364 type:complete len:274 (-) Transcript_13759:139-960(-)